MQNPDDAGATPSNVEEEPQGADGAEADLLLPQTNLPNTPTPDLLQAHTSHEFNIADLIRTALGLEDNQDDFPLIPPFQQVTLPPVIGTRPQAQGDLGEIPGPSGPN